MKHGIDVSEFNGTISWNDVDTDFVFIRGGFGDNTIDAQFYNNIGECSKRHIPFGLYWMSYAVSEYHATVEADTVCDLAEGYGKIPIAFDFEEDSDKYAKRIGHILSNNGVGSPAKINATMCIWQYGQKKFKATGNTDLNIMYIDIFVTEMLDKMIDNFDTEQYIYYMKKAVEVINGDYGNGENRVKLLRKDGYDAEIVQFIVNKILGLTSDINSYLTKEQYPYYKTKAINYKNGSYGNEKEAKKYLNSKGYDFEIIKNM